MTSSSRQYFPRQVVHAGNRWDWALLPIALAVLALMAFVDWGQDSEEIKLGLFAAGIAMGWGLHRWAQVRGRIDPSVLVEAFETGAKYALAVGAAAAPVLIGNAPAPARRKILDIVKEQPGCGVMHVARYFAMSRIAVVRDIGIGIGAAVHAAGVRPGHPDVADV